MADWVATVLLNDGKRRNAETLIRADSSRLWFVALTSPERLNRGRVVFGILRLHARFEMHRPRLLFLAKTG